MRLVVTLLTFLMFAFVLGFVATNLETEVPIRVFDTVHEGVPLYLVGILAVFVGILYAGIIAITEGAHIRLANRRLEREVRKLETEINYLRTQPAVGRREPDSLPGDAVSGGLGGGSRTRIDAGGDRRVPPSAPVYGGDPDAPEDDGDDDEIYTGGRAV